MKLKHRALTLLLTVAMLLTFMPAMAFAETKDSAGVDVKEMRIASERPWYDRVTSISFTPAGSSDRFVYEEGIDLVDCYDENGNLLTEIYPVYFCNGDKIKATISQGDPVTLVCELDEDSFSYDARWKIEGTNKYLDEDEDYMIGFEGPRIDDNQMETGWNVGQNSFFVYFGRNFISEEYVETRTEVYATVTATEEIFKIKAAGMRRLNREDNNIDYSAYRTAERSLIDRAYDDAYYAIDAVDDVNTAQGIIDGAISKFKKAVSNLKTDAQLKAEETNARAVAAEAARQGTPDGSIPKVKASKPKAGKKAITIKWKKLNKKQLKKSKATNYEIWVCPNTGFGAADTIIKNAGKKKASLKVKGLQKGATYFVKVRAIKNVGGVKMVGAWSAVKKVKVK